MFPTLKVFFERWKWNEAHEIWVSTEGRLRDKYKEPIEIMLNENGYPVFFDEKRQVFKNVHRAVLETWCPRDDMRELTVEHKDQNKRNPSLRNLMWLTQEENNRRGKYHNLGSQKKTGNVNKLVCANGVTMTIEDAVTLIYNLPAHNFSRVDIRTKVLDLLESQKQKKQLYGITFTEVKT